jgi:hypothetical protein
MRSVPHHQAEARRYQITRAKRCRCDENGSDLLRRDVNTQLEVAVFSGPKPRTAL